MKSSSSDLADAIDSHEQTLAQKLLVSWDKTGTFAGSYDDLTPTVSSVTVDRSLQGDLPGAVAITEGSGTAQLSADLVRGFNPVENQTAGWTFSRFNAESPLASYDRFRLPTTYDAGFYTSDGPQVLRRFTGSSTDLPVDASGTAYLAAQDRRRDVAMPVKLPMVAADEGDAKRLPGLNAQFLIDWILRQNSIYASPPVRDKCVASLTLHGSAHPEVGTLTQANARDTTTGDVTPVLYTQGKFALAADVGYSTSSTADQWVMVQLDRSYPVNANDGSTIFIEAWIYASDSDYLDLLGLGSSPFGQATQLDVSLSSGQLRYTVSRNDDVSVSFAGPSIPSSSPEWHYLGLRISFTSAQVTITTNIGGTTQTDHHNCASVMNSAPFSVLSLYGQAKMEAVQVTAEDAGASWNDNFTPGAVLETSTNELTATASTSTTDSWELLKEIASSEFGVFFFDEDGVFRYWSRAHWTTAEAQTVQKTIDISDQISSIGYTDSLDNVFNYVEVPASPITLTDPEDVWVAEELMYVLGNSSTSIWVNLDQPAIDIGSYWAPMQTDWSSWFEARPTKDGSSETDTSSITVTVAAVAAQAVLLSIINTSSTTLYFATSEGKPSLHMRGRTVSSGTSSVGSGTTPAAQEGESIATYGWNALSLPRNNWRQSQSFCLGIATALVAQLCRPQPVLTNVTIAADPRLQLGDRIRVLAQSAMGLDGEYRIYRITERRDNSSYTMTLTLRSAEKLLTWDQGAWDQNVWG